MTEPMQFMQCTLKAWPIHEHYKLPERYQMDGMHPHVHKVHGVDANAPPLFALVLECKCTPPIWQSAISGDAPPLFTQGQRVHANALPVWNTRCMAANSQISCCSPNNWPKPVLTKRADQVALWSRYAMQLL